MIEILEIIQLYTNYLYKIGIPDIITVQINNYRQISAIVKRKCHRTLEIVIIAIKQLEMNQILALNGT